MNKYIFIGCLLFTNVVCSYAQNIITGVVKDKQGNLIQGAQISECSNPSNSTLTDDKGIFTLNVDGQNYIQVNYADKSYKRVLKDNSKIIIVLDDKDLINRNEGIIKTGLTNTGAVAVLKSDEIEKNSTPNLRNSMFGLLPGLIQTQNTGYNANPGMNIRGRGTFSGALLYVVDGFVRNIDDINPADVETVSVLKDAAAVALYGVRGANGVILITTKRGSYKSKNINVNYTYGMDLPINKPTMVDAQTYAKAVNEAMYYDGFNDQRYTEDQINAYGTPNDYYPNSNWLDAATRDYATNHQFDICFNGGGEKLRYYSSFYYKNYKGIISPDYAKYNDRYKSQVGNYKLGARLNMDIDVTRSTLVKVGMNVILNEDQNTNGLDGKFSNLSTTPANVFPIKTVSGNWGGNQLYTNPIADICDKGYSKYNQRLLQADLKLQQNLSMITPGLKAEISGSIDNNVIYQETGSKTYSFETNVEGVEPVISGLDNALSISNSSYKSQYINSTILANLSYEKGINNHLFSVNAIYKQESSVQKGQNSSRYRQYIVGIVDYNYANRYLLNGVVNYSGSSILPEGDQFKLYPTASFGWIISNENFFKNISFINFLKLRGSVGESSIDENNNLAYDLDKQYFEYAAQYSFGDANTTSSGDHLSTLPVENYQLERSTKVNIGLDIQLFKNLSLTIDAFKDYRRHILITGNKLLSGVMGQDASMDCIGSMDSEGLEIAGQWKVSRNHFSYYIGGNVTLLNSNVNENGEGYKPYAYLYEKGHLLGQAFGLVQAGYFNSFEEINDPKTPVHTYSDVRPGDIRYVDQNGDNLIDDNDKVAIGHSTTIPGIYYGINLGIEYKGFGINAIFQGLGKYSKFLTTGSLYQPLGNKGNISKWYYNDHTRWTETTKETANLPRLSTLDNKNNTQKSTQWLVDGSYLKLRNLDVYYNIPLKAISKVKLQKFQVFVRGNNLFSIDKIKYSNCEDLGLNYLDMLSVFAGCSLNF